MTSEQKLKKIVYFITVPPQHVTSGLFYNMHPYFIIFTGKELYTIK
jgi:hypothetical protein